MQRTLDPLGLVLKGGAWYLVAHRSAGMRVYRVSRFASVRVREEGFERPEGFELASYWDEWSRSFEASRPQVEVKIRASELVRRFLPGELHGEDGVYVVGLREPRRSLPRAAQVRARRARCSSRPELRSAVATAAGEVAALYGLDLHPLRPLG